LVKGPDSRVTKKEKTRFKRPPGAKEGLHKTIGGNMAEKKAIDSPRGSWGKGLDMRLGGEGSHHFLDQRGATQLRGFSSRRCGDLLKEDTREKKEIKKKTDRRLCEFPHSSRNEAGL